MLQDISDRKRERDRHGEKTPLDKRSEFNVNDLVMDLVGNNSETTIYRNAVLPASNRKSSSTEDEMVDTSDELINMHIDDNYTFGNNFVDGDEKGRSSHHRRSDYRRGSEQPEDRHGDRDHDSMREAE